MQSEITEAFDGGRAECFVFLQSGKAAREKSRQRETSVLRDQESPMLFILRTTVDWLIPM